MPVGGQAQADSTSRTGKGYDAPTSDEAGAVAAGEVSAKDDSDARGGGGGEAQQAPPPPIDLSGAGGAGVDHGPTDTVPGESGYLMGPTSRPTESMTAGLLPSGHAKPPSNISVTLAALQEAAQDPQAPPQLHSLLKLLNYHLANQ